MIPKKLRNKMRIFLNALSTIPSFLAFLEYVFVWRSNLEAMWGPYAVGFMEGSVVVVVFVLAIYIFACAKFKGK